MIKTARRALSTYLYILLFVGVSHLGSVVHAATPQEFQDAAAAGSDFGTATSTGPSTAIQGGQVIPDAPAFNAQGDLPQYTNNPAEANYYTPSNASNLSTDGAALTNSTDCTRTNCASGGTNAVTTSYTQRETFVLDPNTDPLIQNSMTALDNPQQVIGDINDQYSGCQSVTTNCDTTFSEANCDETIKTTDNVCHDNLTVLVAWVQNCQQGSVLTSGSRMVNSAGMDDYVHWRVICDYSQPDNIRVDLYADEGPGGGGPHCTGWTQNYLPAAGSTPTTTSGLVGIPNGTSVPSSLVMSLRPSYAGNTCNYVHVFWEGSCDAQNVCNINLHFYNVVWFGWFVSTWILQSIHNVPVATFEKPAMVPQEEDIWNSDCAQYQNVGFCTPSPGVCLDGPSMRTINNVDVQRDCWEYEYTYTCAAAPSNENCQVLRDQGCEQVNANCIATFPNGECSVNQEFYRCPDQACSNTDVICGDQAFCIDGSCANTAYDPNGNMALAAAQLQSLNDVKNSYLDSMDVNNLFGGVREYCEIGLVSWLTYDCCSDSGFINNTVSGLCSQSSLRAFNARQAETAHYIGQYCSDTFDPCVIGSCAFCIEDSKVYCVYNSELARIIQEGAHIQLNIGWGSPQSPNCGPLTLDQIQALDFSDPSMNFASFYDNVLGSMTVVDPQQLQNSIEQSVQNTFAP